MTLTLTLQNFEFFLLIFVRITGFIVTAPFFSLKNVPFRVKTGFSILLAIIVLLATTNEPLEYIGVIGYTTLVVKTLSE